MLDAYAAYWHETLLMRAVWEQLRTHFGSNRGNLVASHAHCANTKKAHTLFTLWPSSRYLTEVNFHGKQDGCCAVSQVVEAHMLSILLMLMVVSYIKLISDIPLFSGKKGIHAWNNPPSF